MALRGTTGLTPNLSLLVFKYSVGRVDGVEPLSTNFL